MNILPRIRDIKCSVRECDEEFEVRYHFSTVSDYGDVFEIRWYTPWDTRPECGHEQDWEMHADNIIDFERGRP